MVGPDYETPTADSSEAWIGAQRDVAAGQDALGPDSAWWTSFGDPRLDALVAEAIRQNLALREAGLRVIQARALRGIAIGELFPQTQLGVGDVGANQISRNAPAGSGDRHFSEYGVGLEAAWELDFWGRFRRGIESADSALDATIADFDGGIVLVAAETASSYVRIRSLQQQIEFTRGNVRSQQDTLELTEVRLLAGAVSELDVSTARATLSNTQALVPELEDLLWRTIMSLGTLLGRTPSDLADELGGIGEVPTAPSQIALGVPADLLRRRPDIRRAERVAAALSAQIGVATADLYPTVTVKGLTGFRTSTYDTPGYSPSASNLFDADSFEGFVGLDVSWPILNYGRIENNIRVADARFQEAVEGYRRLVLAAAAEVETGLSSFLRNRDRAVLLAESVTAAERTVELSLIQYRQGAVDFLRVNQAQVDLVERQNALVQAWAGVAQGAISTYRALGGGWEVYGAPEFVPASTIDEMRRRTDWGDMLGTADPVQPAEVAAAVEPRETP